jgi:phosphatidate phosphatase APP1
MKDRDESDPEPAGPPATPGLKLRLEEKLGVLGDLRLVGYRGHGTRRSLHVKGRLIEADAESSVLGGEGSLLHNLLTTIRRFDSDEIPGARLLARFDESEYELYTDKEGYFQLNLYLDEPLADGWHQVQIELVDSVKEGARASVAAEALVPPERCDFAVVSDLDDTVVKSSADDKIEQARLTLFNDAASRMPFAGVDALYRAWWSRPARAATRGRAPS